MNAGEARRPTDVLATILGSFYTWVGITLGGVVLALWQSNRWAVVWLALPIIVARLRPWRLSPRDVKDFWKDQPYLKIVGVFLAVALLLFGFPTLDRHPEVGSYQSPQRNWMGWSAGLQDGTLALAPEDQHSHRFAVLLLPAAWLSSLPIQTRPMLGRVVDDIVKLHEAGGRIKGIALDIALPEQKPPLPASINAAFCKACTRARTKFDVLLAYAHDEKTFKRIFTSKAIEKLTMSGGQEDPNDVGCFTEKQQGHSMGYGEVDEVVRFVPLYLEGPGVLDSPSLSIRAAQAVARKQNRSLDLDLHKSLIWLLPTKRIDVVRYTEFEAKKSELQDRFVFIGFADPKDHRKLPHREAYGVEVHALAAEVLLQRHYVHATPNWTNVVGIVLLCLLLAILVHKGVSSRAVVGWCALATGLLLVIPLFAMGVSRVWIDMPFVPMALLAMLLLLPLRRTSLVPTAEESTARRDAADKEAQEAARAATQASEAPGAKVLMFAANPMSTGRLDLGQEAKKIRESLREHAAFDFDIRLAVGPDELMHALNEEKPEVVHFSGHGEGAGGIVLRGEQGEALPASADVLKSVFAALKDDICVVVLCACHSAEQANAIREVIDCVIGMEDAIADEAAIRFSGAFYSALGFGRSVQNAFDQAIARMGFADAGEGQQYIPVLLCREGVDANDVFVSKPAEPPPAPDDE